jgi:hypothetical protein
MQPLYREINYYILHVWNIYKVFPQFLLIKMGGALMGDEADREKQEWLRRFIWENENEYDYF